MPHRNAAGIFCPVSRVIRPGQTSILSSLGYITIAPDYIGMLGFGEPSPEGSIHPYLIAAPTALASLDAVRAALAYLAADPDLQVRPGPGGNC